MIQTLTISIYHDKKKLLTHPYKYDTLFKYYCSVGVISPIKESTNLNKGTQNICAPFVALIEKIPGF